MESARSRTAAVLVCAYVVALGLGCGGDSGTGPDDNNNFPPPARVVVIEHYTNANCIPCRPVEENLATAFGVLGTTRVVSFGTHTDFPGIDPFFSTRDSAQFRERYESRSVLAVPQVNVDGVKVTSPSDFDALLARILEAAAVAPQYDVIVTTATVADSFIVSGSVTHRVGAPLDGVLTVAVVESGITYRALDGVNLAYSDVTRTFPTGALGVALTITSGGSVNFRYAVPIGMSWNVGNLDAVACVQSSATRVVYGTGSTL
ncbi:MAG: hypothetical protein ACKVU1_12750 [bacterium]